MKKEIKTTHIDNCSHGYLSVSKKDFLLVCEKTDISGFSGMDFTRVYLEEDSDASLFIEKAKALGYTVKVKSGYNPNFKISHNYSANLFDIKPENNPIVWLYDDMQYRLSLEGNNIIATNVLTYKRYRLSKTNPFKYIKDVEAIKVND